MVFTSVIALVSGALTGKLLASSWFTQPRRLFSDVEYWEVSVDDEEIGDNSIKELQTL